MHDNEADAEGDALVSTRTMEIVVAMVLLIGSIIFIFDSMRSGIGWRDDGPAPGFFPFWVAAILAVASVVNLIRAIPDRAAAEEAFVLGPQFARVLAVLVPTTLYVAAIGGVEFGPLKVPGLGIYVSSAVFIAGFMGMLYGDETKGGSSRIATTVGLMAAAGILISALLWVLTKGNLPLAAVDVPYALILSIGLVALPLGSQWKIVTLGPAVAVVLYAMFEIWFKVPLVKGPVEAMLGIA